MLAARKVAGLLKIALGTPRVALIFEGTGVPHVHAKLYPLYGDNASKTNVWSDHTEYPERCRKNITVEGPRRAIQNQSGSIHNNLSK